MSKKKLDYYEKEKLVNDYVAKYNPKTKIMDSRLFYKIGFMKWVDFDGLAKYALTKKENK